MAGNNGSETKVIGPRTTDTAVVKPSLLKERSIGWDPEVDSVDGDDTPEKRDSDFKRKQVGGEDQHVKTSLTTF